MALNLLPLLPLDGGRIVAGLLPKKLASQFARIEPYGFYILIALSLTSVLSLLMAPFLLTGYAIIGTIFGFNFF
jgi:Zn-dependent protease